MPSYPLYNETPTLKPFLGKNKKSSSVRLNQADYPNVSNHLPSNQPISIISEYFIADNKISFSAQENYKGIDVESKTKATIYHDGQVAWLSPHILKSVCKMDVTYFPFDDQRCPMVFASWAYHGLHVNISSQREAGDLVSYSESGEFKLMSE